MDLRVLRAFCVYFVFADGSAFSTPQWHRRERDRDKHRNPAEQIEIVALPRNEVVVAVPLAGPKNRGFRPSSALRANTKTPCKKSI
jgi:hypothetical protein